MKGYRFSLLQADHSQSSGGKIKNGWSLTHRTLSRHAQGQFTFQTCQGVREGIGTIWLETRGDQHIVMLHIS